LDKNTRKNGFKELGKVVTESIKEQKGEEYVAEKAMLNI
jgi:hypothetical protein